MVVPGSTPGIQHDRAVAAKDGSMDTDNEPDCSSDLKEVHKLQELVRRLEIQNQQLRIKKTPPTTNDSGIDNRLSTLNCTGVLNSMNIPTDREDLEIIPNLHAKLGEIHSEKENIPRLRMDSQMQYGTVSSDSKPASKGGSHCDTDDSSFFSMDVSGVTDLDEAMRKMSDRSPDFQDLEHILDESALDEVEVLELDSCSEDEEDCWLYVSPKKLSMAEMKPDSPLKWCRQVLDHHSPETEAACRTLIGKLDQASRWKSLYCSPLASPSAYNGNNESSCSNTLNSPGCLKSTNKPLLTCGSSGHLSVHSALSSQSSVDSELSTSDDSISMGYKLQDLTDVQVMARLQEESLRQDYASSSASVSRRSSSASLHSLRRGTFSDQEFDTYSLEDDDDCDCSLSFRSAHRYSPSPLSSPRCQSPSATGDGRSASSRIRPPRRSMQNPLQDRMKYPGCEDDLRHSMPNLAKTSLRSLEAVRSSRSLESDLQGPSSRLTRIQPPTVGTPPSKMRYSSGQSAAVRQPSKAGLSTSSLLNSRQPIKSSGYNSSSGVRKIQSPGGLAAAIPGAVSRTSNSSPNIKPSGMKSPSAAYPAPKSKMMQPPRRSMNSKAHTLDNDDSWKDGCY